MNAALLATIVQASITYGIPFAQNLIALFKKQEISISDVETLFANVKRYEDYNIPDVVPAPNPPPAP